MMLNDPIVEEIRRIREDFARKFNYDLEAMVEYLRKKEQEHPERLVYLTPKLPRERVAAQETPESYNPQ